MFLKFVIEKERSIWWICKCKRKRTCVLRNKAIWRFSENVGILAFPLRVIFGSSLVAFDRLTCLSSVIFRDILYTRAYFSWKIFNTRYSSRRYIVIYIRNLENKFIPGRGINPNRWGLILIIFLIILFLNFSGYSLFIVFCFSNSRCPIWNGDFDAAQWTSFRKQVRMAFYILRLWCRRNSLVYFLFDFRSRRSTK